MYFLLKTATYDHLILHHNLRSIFLLSALGPVAGRTSLILYTFLGTSHQVFSHKSHQKYTHVKYTQNCIGFISIVNHWMSSTRVKFQDHTSQQSKFDNDRHLFIVIKPIRCRETRRARIEKWFSDRVAFELRLRRCERARVWAGELSRTAPTRSDL